jgi:putative endopeptidase
MKNQKKLAKILSLAFVLTGVISCSSPEKKEYSGIKRSNIDTTINPAHDFYSFANGGWLKNNPIPSTESRWGSFNELQENNYKALRIVLEEAASSKAAEGTNTQKVGDFYTTGMDSAKIESEGIKSLSGELAKINEIKDVKGFVDAAASIHTYGVAPLYNFYAYQDLKNSTKVVPYVSQGGLGLPDRDYYFSNDERSSNIRKEYISHLTKVFELLGENNNPLLIIFLV